MCFIMNFIFEKFKKSPIIPESTMAKVLNDICAFERTLQYLNFPI